MNIKQFIYKFIFVSIVVYFFCLGWQHIIDKGLRTSAEYGENYIGWDRIYKGGIDADVIILGSSRAKILIDPSVVTDSIGKTCYNLGIDGHKFLTQYYRYFLYLQHNKAPKTILLTLDLLSLIHTKDFYAYEQFIPYLKDTMIENIIMPSEVLTWKDVYIPMVKFTHRKDMILDATMSFFKPITPKANDVNGFKSVDLPFDTAVVRKTLNVMFVDGYTAKIDPETKRLFYKFIAYCKSNNIQLVFVYPPEYASNLNLCANKKYITHYYDSISAAQKIPYFNYMNTPKISNDTALFFDSQHMNTKGVIIFNKIFMSDLKRSKLNL